MQSSDFQLTLAGGAKCAGRRWLPRGAAEGIVQVIHGMAEHSGRYARLAESLTGAGYAVYAHDLPGHGPHCPSEQRGHLADRRGWRLAIASIRNTQRLAQQEQPRLPVFMLGHSMGSFLLQHYMADFGNTLAGAVLSATTGDAGALRRVGLALVRAEAVIYGRRHPSAVGERLSFRNYNRAFKPARTDFDWLSRDPEEVDRYIADPHCGFRCTTGLWLELLDALGSISRLERVRRIPERLPVYMMAGSSDPVSNGGRGPEKLARLYRKAGVRNVTVKVYPEARHELLNDTCRDEVTADLLQWLGNHLPRRVSQQPL